MPSSDIQNLTPAQIQLAYDQSNGEPITDRHVKRIVQEIATMQEEVALYQAGGTFEADGQKVVWSWEPWVEDLTIDLPPGLAAEDVPMSIEKMIFDHTMQIRELKSRAVAWASQMEESANTSDDLDSDT